MIIFNSKKIKHYICPFSVNPHTSPFINAHRPTTDFCRIRNMLLNLNKRKQTPITELILRITLPNHNWSDYFSSHSLTLT